MNIIIATSDSEQFCSDDILKCYHYSVEIQKILKPLPKLKHDSNYMLAKSDSWFLSALK